jgi:hypothetical protein
MRNRRKEGRSARNRTEGARGRATTMYLADAVLARARGQGQQRCRGVKPLQPDLRLHSKATKRRIRRRKKERKEGSWNEKKRRGPEKFKGKRE